MQVNIIESYRHIVAICDTELLGKQFEEGKKQLNIKKNFYTGKEKNKQEVKKIIQEMSLENATFNIVGKESINAAIEAGIINKKGIGEIHGIPFTIVLV
jgi:uncharacterized protein